MRGTVDGGKEGFCFTILYLSVLRPFPLCPNFSFQGLVIEYLPFQPFCADIFTSPPLGALLITHQQIQST